MKTPCPKCGRGTAIEEDIGDFPLRCERCGALLRRRNAGEPVEGLNLPTITTARVKRGSLSGLLTRPAGNDRAAVAVACEGARNGILRPESRRVVARAHARQKALERAQLHGNHQALGALTWAGMLLAVLLGIGAVVLKAHSLWQHPVADSADVLRVQ